MANWHNAGARNDSTNQTSAPSDPMILDSEHAKINGNAMRSETLYLSRELEAYTSETTVSELLPARLRLNSPFGKVVPLLISYSTLLNQ